LAPAHQFQLAHQQPIITNSFCSAWTSWLLLLLLLLLGLLLLHLQDRLYVGQGLHASIGPRAQSHR
jgi:hypothetical protein